MKYKILLIEDDDSQRDALREAIIRKKDELNASVTVASDGHKAIELSKNHHFDIVVTDFLMPNMNGLEFLIEFKKNDPDSRVPIIFISGYMDEVEASKCAVPHEICLPSDKLNEFGGTFHARTQKI